METEILTALVAAVASLAVATVSATVAVASSRQSREAEQKLAAGQADLQRELVRLNAEVARAVRVEERAETARAQLDQRREPLMLAALDLGHRLKNIRQDAFLDAYLASENSHRSSVARTSTLYRFARYWSVVEALYDSVALGHFESAQSTRSVAMTMRDIGRTFADDALDDGRFMMWREEQRAIAELMRAGDGGPLGYASFVSFYSDRFHPWFINFDGDLTACAGRGSERFKRLQGHLARLAEQLDITGAYKEQWKALVLE